jgi:hypothetical protein
MAPLAKKWFKATGDLHPRIAGHLVTDSFGQPVANVLARLDWDGNLVACIGLELSPDNKHMAHSQFMLQGLPKKEPVEIQANNLWASAQPGTKLSITIPDGKTFIFTGGTLASDYVSGEDFSYSFSKDGSTIVPTEWTNHGVGEIAIRAICHLDKSSNVKGPSVKVTILVFPNSIEELSELSAATLSPAWPGIRILENTCGFFPKSTDWKDPCCPLIMLGCTQLHNTNLPPGAEIRFHISALMRTARRPTICNKLSTLKKQLEKAMADVESMELEPTIVWPDVPRHAPNAGKKHNCYFKRLPLSSKPLLSLFRGKRFWCTGISTS